MLLERAPCFTQAGSLGIVLLISDNHNIGVAGGDISVARRAGQGVSRDVTVTPRDCVTCHVIIA